MLWFTVQQVSKKVQISDEAVLAHIHAGRLKASNVGGGRVRPRWRIHEDDLNSFLSGRSPQPKPTARRKRATAGAGEIQFFK